MGHRVRQVEKERLVSIRLDELKCEFGIESRQLALVRILLQDLVIPHERQGVRKALAPLKVVVHALARESCHIGALASGDHPLVLWLPDRHHRVVAPHVVREGDPEPAVESVPVRQVFRRVAQMPLADHPCDVAPLLEHLGDCDLVRMNPCRRLGAVIETEAGAWRI